MKSLITTMLALGLLVGNASAGSCGSATHSHETTAEKASATVTAKMDIVETAVSTEGFGTLVAALKAAGLVDALKGEGPFTVFAPTDEAFAALPAGTLEKVLTDKKLLTSILTYHVVEGAVKAETVVGLDKAQTLNGQDVKIMVSDKGVMINDANVVATDIVCSNGVIHVIDKVILPTTEG
ncbi:MAG: fasciclin domain-containing protein [candidate division Zixibacteria bacterium]|nr:fasciclin domain-containing protein [candidate division Zixibacteria bacterium]